MRPFIFLLNILLPGMGLLFNTNKKLNPTRLLVIVSMHWLLLVSAVLVISWSGLIFHDKGFYYLLLAYAFVSLLSCLHLSLLLKKLNYNHCLPKPKPKLGIKVAVQIVFPLVYTVSLALILINKAVLLGWQVYQIPSVSMFPTLKRGNIILADTRTSTLNNLTHQDIIIFTRPVKYIGINPRQISSIAPPKPIFYIKRLIASNGDFVKVSNHQLIVNNQVIKRGLTEKSRDEQQIKSNAIFVVGDNINQSSDSRSWGQLPTNNVVAKFSRVVY